MMHALSTPSRVHGAFKRAPSTRATDERRASTPRPARRTVVASPVVAAGLGSLFPFGGDKPSNAAKGASSSANAGGFSQGAANVGSTNEVAEVVDGMRRKRLGDTDILVSEYSLSDNWLNRHGIVPETEEQLLMQALQGALYRLMLDEARSEGVRITQRLEALTEDPGTSEDPEGEEVHLLRKKMGVSKRVGRIAGHFGSTILHRMSEEDVQQGQA